MKKKQFMKLIESTDYKKSIKIIKFQEYAPMTLSNFFDNSHLLVAHTKIRVEFLFF